MTQNLPPMDWYPDPADQTRERYWDGQQWTHNTRAATARPSAPSDPWAAQGAPQPAAPSSQQPGAPTLGQPTDQQREAAPTPQGPAGGQGSSTPQLHQQSVHPAGFPATATTNDGVPLAGWWARVGAEILDAIILGILGPLLSWPWTSQVVHGFLTLFRETMATVQAGGQPPTVLTPTDLERYGVTTNALLMISAIGFLVALVYWTLCWRLRGASLGQSAAGVRVVPAGAGQAPRRLPWSQAIVRAVVKSVLNAGGNVPGAGTMLVLVGLLSDLLPLFTRTRQTLHDMAARTQVVRTR